MVHECAHRSQSVSNPLLSYSKWQEQPTHLGLQLCLYTGKSNSATSLYDSCLGIALHSCGNTAIVYCKAVEKLNNYYDELCYL